MKKMKLFPKTFFYTLGLMLFIVGIAHLLLYLFTKPEWLVISVSPHDELSLNPATIPDLLCDYFHSLFLCIFTENHGSN